MNNEKDLQKQIDELKRRLDNFNAFQTIPLPVDLAWQNRGFVKTDFFVAGTGEIASNGTYSLAIPGSDRNSIALATTFATSTAGIDGAQMVQGYANNNFGAASTQFDITNPAGTTFRYTWDGTGTDPLISASTLPTGSRVVVFIGGNPLNSNAASRPYFIVTGSGANYFEVDNSVGVAENNVTIGAGGSITGGPQVPSPYELLVTGTATAEFGFVVFLFPSLFIEN